MDRRNEGARFWLKVFNDVKARGVQDILALCADGLTSLPEAVGSVFPVANVQLRVVHQIRDATKFVSYKDRKAFCADMRPIYTAPTNRSGRIGVGALCPAVIASAANHVDEWEDENWRRRSARHPKQSFDEPLLADNFAFWQPADLAFSDHVHCFVSHDCAQRPVN